MTIGEKIRYFRKQLGITQDRLAEMTGIHPVSIRKYETNKMQPQPAQLERVAAALGVSYNAINGVDRAGLRLKTVGDLMGILIVLYNSGIIQIDGERGSDFFLKYETVSIHFNPILSSYFQVRDKKKSFALEDVVLNIKGDIIFQCLLKWENMCFLYTSSVLAAEREQSEAAWAAVKEIENAKEMVELELQKSQLLLV